MSSFENDDFGRRDTTGFAVVKNVIDRGDTGIPSPDNHDVCCGGKLRSRAVVVQWVRGRPPKGSRGVLDRKRGTGHGLGERTAP